MKAREAIWVGLMEARLTVESILIFLDYKTKEKKEEKQEKKKKKKGGELVWLKGILYVKMACYTTELL